MHGIIKERNGRKGRDVLIRGTNRAGREARFPALRGGGGRPGGNGIGDGVVVLSSLAAGLGSVHRGGAAGILVGTKILPEPRTSATQGELLRTIGFSSSPGLIRILGVIPGTSGVVFLGASVWMLVAMVIAVRQALDYENTMRAVGVCLIGWLMQSAVLVLFLLFFYSRIP